MLDHKRETKDKYKQKLVKKRQGWQLKDEEEKGLINANIGKV